MQPSQIRKVASLSAQALRERRAEEMIPCPRSCYVTLTLRNDPTVRRDDGGLINARQNAIIIGVGRLGSNCGRLLLAPPISGRLQIMFEHVAPRHHDRNQHDAQKTVNQRFCPPEAYS